MAERRRGLGRGLGALIPNGDAQEQTTPPAVDPRETASRGKQSSRSGATETPDRSSSRKAGTAKGVRATLALKSADEDRQEATPRATATPKKTATKSNKTEASGADAEAAGKKAGPTGDGNRIGTSVRRSSRSTKTGEAGSEKGAGTKPDAAKSKTQVSTTKNDANAAGSRSDDVSRETSDSPKAPASRGSKSPRTRRDMGQALRSTTNVRRPVDMFFLPSSGDEETDAENSDDFSRTDEVRDSSQVGEVTPSSAADGSHQETERNTPTNAGQGNQQVKSGSADVSRETSVQSSTTWNIAPPSASADGAADTVGENIPASDVIASQRQAVTTEHSAQEDLQSIPGATFAEISVTDIHPNRKQPRQDFDEDELAELVFSVKELGVLQPIVVRPSHEGGEQKYELVMGERRWRAVQEAGLAVIPAIIRDTADDDLLRDALLENLHRAQLNPLEEAAAYQQLMEEFGATQEQLSERIGRSRPQISNTLRLLRLPALVQRRVAAGVLSSGHARALLALTDPAEMERVAQRIVAEGLSVRATEELVALSDGLKRHATKRKTPVTRHDDRLGYIADAFSDKLDTSVKIQLGARKGKMTIEFASVEDLNRIIDVLDPKLDAN